MANDTTKLADVINPEVMAPMIEAKITAKCKVLPYAHIDTSLQGVAGDTKTVPCWNYVGDAEDFNPENAEGKEIETSKLTATSTTFTIKCAAKAISIFQTAINSGLGDPIGQGETQLAKSIVGKLDNDVLAAAYTSGNVYDGTSGVIGYAGVVDATGTFEDEEDGIDKVMFINPKQFTTLLKDDDFRSADKFTDGVALKGAIGEIAGCWIKKSRKVIEYHYAKDSNGTITIVADGTSESATSKHLATIQPECFDTLAVGDKVKAVDYFVNPVIKCEPDDAETEYTEDELPALTIFLKKDTQVDHEWFPKKQRHDITASKYYGAALTNAEKVVLAKFKAKK